MLFCGQEKFGQKIFLLQETDMSKKYVWNVSNTYTVFSSVAVRKPINFENQNSDLLNSMNSLQVNDQIRGNKNETEIFVILKVN